MDKNSKIWTKNRKYGHKIWMQRRNMDKYGKYGHRGEIWKNMENMDMEMHPRSFKPN